MTKEIFKKDDVNALAKANRERMYQQTSDKLFFQAQRGEIDIEDWKSAVLQIKAKFPYVENDIEIDID